MDLTSDRSAATAGSCSSRSFSALMATVFFGALNDNVFKLSVSFLALQAALAHEMRVLYLALIGSFFVVPFILVSPHAGLMADRFQKVRVIRWTRLVELIIMLPAFYFFETQQIAGLLVILLVLGTQSALFSPCKYGLLPEMLSEAELSRGNGFTEFWTFGAAVLGTVLAGLLSSFGDGFRVHAGVVLGIALLGVLSSLLIQQPAGVGERPSISLRVNPFRQIFSDLALLRKDQAVFLALLAIAFFWGLASFFQLNTLLYAEQSANLGEVQTSLLLCILAVGIGVGSTFAGRVSAGKVEIGLVPLGAFGLAIFSAALSISYRHYYVTALIMLLIGLSSGLYLVPLNAYFQKNVPAGARGRFLAANNFVSYCFMLLASLFLLACGYLLHVKSAWQFALAGVIAFVVALQVLRRLPDALLRCMNWLLANTLYSLRVFHLDNVPSSGGALIVCNHVSYADPPLLQAALARPARFLMYRPIYENKLINPVARLMRAIPVATEDGPKATLRALLEARRAVQEGELVCLFAEGELSRTGQMLPFNRGLEQIMKGVNAPIIPAYIDQIWGSIFSYERGRYFKKIPKQIPYPVSIVFGRALPGDSSAFTVRQAVQELGTEAFPLRQRKHQLLQLGFIDAARRRPFHNCMSDSSGMRLNYISALAAGFVLARRLLKKLTAAEKHVGVLLPPSVGCALSNIALLLAGKVPVNLNYTSGEEALKAALARAGIKSVITSRAFLEKVPLRFEAQSCFVEDELKALSKAALAAWGALLYFLPAGLTLRLAGAQEVSRDATATIIFSSGSTGIPKGVVLSHGNVVSNLESLYDVLHLQRDDVFLGVLPFFHSFGFTGGLWLPLLGGISVSYHVNPLDGETIGKICAKENVTVLLSTPTFLLTYIRKCEPEQLKRVRRVVTGAEKLKTRIAQAFSEKFGVEPMEGYGCTELSPVALINVPNYRDQAVNQVGNKPGSAGHPIPGVAVKVVDPETLSALPAGESGLLLVKGPNVMQGYLGEPQMTAEVIKDGWYLTGDLAAIDADGFVTIQDRLSRFSKIGGEMVPHQGVEEAIQKALNSLDQICAVTAVPDEKKGERLVVLLKAEVDRAAVIEALKAAGLPNLWIPRQDSFYVAGEIPLLGSGKLDLKKIKEIARDKTREGA